MIGKIKELIQKPLSEIGLVPDSINYSKGNLEIILDGDDLSIDNIVKATKIINPILDKADLIKEKYILDVSSKEKGE